MEKQTRRSSRAKKEVSYVLDDGQYKHYDNTHDQQHSRKTKRSALSEFLLSSNNRNQNDNSKDKNYLNSQENQDEESENGGNQSNSDQSDASPDQNDGSDFEPEAQPQEQHLLSTGLGFSKQQKYKKSELADVPKVTAKEQYSAQNSQNSAVLNQEELDQMLKPLTKTQLNQNAANQMLIAIPTDNTRKIDEKEAKLREVGQKITHGELAAQQDQRDIFDPENPAFVPLNQNQYAAEKMTMNYQSQQDIEEKMEEKKEVDQGDNSDKFGEVSDPEIKDQDEIQEKLRLELMRQYYEQARLITKKAQINEKNPQSQLLRAGIQQENQQDPNQLELSEDDSVLQHQEEAASGSSISSNDDMQQRNDDNNRNATRNQQEGESARGEDSLDYMDYIMEEVAVPTTSLQNLSSEKHAQMINELITKADTIQKYDKQKYDPEKNRPHEFAMENQNMQKEAKQKGKERQQDEKVEKFKAEQGMIGDFMPRFVKQVDWDQTKFRQAMGGLKDQIQLPYFEGDEIEGSTLQCLVSWNPKAANPGYVPEDSFVSYADLRTRCPIVLVDYFERKVNVWSQSDKDSKGKRKERIMPGAADVSEKGKENEAPSSKESSKAQIQINTQMSHKAPETTTKPQTKTQQQSLEEEKKQQV